MTSAAQARTHRRDLDTLVGIAHNDLRILMGRYDAAEDMRDALIVYLPRLVAVYGAAAATLAADWYADLRDSSAVRGRFTPVTAELPDTGRTDALARWGVGPMFAADPDKTLSFDKVSGGLQRIIGDADRSTITVSTVDDPRARGWTRVTSGGCAYCESLAGTSTSAEFNSHDNCRCVAAPFWG